MEKVSDLQFLVDTPLSVCFLRVSSLLHSHRSVYI